MRSTSGQYFLNLDHVRACAVLMVFVWHFNHFESGNIQLPLMFPLSILTEGHTGVSVFLTLSGFLFAKLLGAKKIRYRLFLLNRALRLFPLLIVVILIGVIQGLFNSNSGVDILRPILKGFIWPTWPNGGWSITVEMHFYLILPVLLWIFIKKRLRWAFFVFTLLFIIRYLQFRLGVDIQFRSYYTILGRFDQFAFGILAFRYRDEITRTRGLVPIVCGIFLIYFTFFDFLGGYYGPFNFGQYSWIWIFQLSIEGLAYAVIISWYDKVLVPVNYFTRAIAKVGQLSYSIYLLHCFFIFSLPGFIDRNILDISNSYVKLIAAILVFFVFVPIAGISFKYLESPFLRHRRNYIY